MELNNALANAECIISNQFNQGTPLTLRSRVIGGNSGKTNNLRSRNKELLKSEIVKSETSHGLTLYLLASCYKKF